RHVHLARQVGVVEAVRVTQPLAGNELDILAAKGMAMAGREVPERHLERTTDLRLQMVHGAYKAVGRQPFRERVGFEEGAIDFLRARRQNAVQAYGVRHICSSMNCRFEGRTKPGRSDTGSRRRIPMVPSRNNGGAAWRWRIGSGGRPRLPGCKASCPGLT